MPGLSGAGSILLGGNTLTVTVGGYITYPPSFTGPISGSGGLILQLTAGNALALGGNNTYTGGTTVRSGFLLYSDDANLGAPAGTLTLDGGGIKFARNGTVTWPVVVGSGGARFTTDPGTTSSLPSQISGSGYFAVNSVGDTVISGTVAMAITKNYDAEIAEVSERTLVLSERTKSMWFSTTMPAASCRKLPNACADAWGKLRAQYLRAAK